jgi:hypothetical protein
MRDSDRDLVITPGAAVHLDRACARDAAHPVIETVGTLLHLIPADGRQTRTIGDVAARRMSAAHTVIL